MADGGGLVQLVAYGHENQVTFGDRNDANNRNSTQDYINIPFKRGKAHIVAIIDRNNEVQPLIRVARARPIGFLERVFGRNL